MPRWSVSEDHPLRDFFRSLVHGSLHVQMGLEDQDVEDYLAGLITEYVHLNATTFEVDGEPIEELVVLAEHGDIRQKAPNFQREREVHKLIGDFLMFWGGVFPEQLNLLKKKGAPTGFVNPVAMGKASYHLVSTFDHGDYATESMLYRKLSTRFETYLFALHLVREAWESDRDEWSEGFRA